MTQSGYGIEDGLRLSYATLGAFMKYPKESLPKKPTKHIIDKKYGFFQSEKDKFIDVAKELGLNKVREGEDVTFSRHPLAYLVEAADDICYTIIDFEDGINLGLVEEELALEYMIRIVQDKIDIQKYNSLELKKDRISYLRALAISNLIQEAAEIFVQNEEAILKGDFDKGLLDKCKYEAQIKDIINKSIDKIYESKGVIEKEVAGYKIIADLLDVFITAVNNQHNGEARNYDELILMMLPKEYKVQSSSLYERVMSVCAFIAGMSDSYAILIHKKISGVITS